MEKKIEREKQVKEMGLGPWGCLKMGKNIRHCSPKPGFQRLNSYLMTIESRKRLFKQLEVKVHEGLHYCTYPAGIGCIDLGYPTNLVSRS